MKVRAAGLFDANQDMAIEEIEIDDPKDGEVLSRIAGTGVCRSDLSGARNTATPVPVILGHEGSGVTEKVARGVTRVKPGDHVVLS